ncbi:MAG TPA: hypothetical protein VHL80_03115 [Polyangia bacterium]|nr:hypothetical protein [Polyangia bacterium]
MIDPRRTLGALIVLVSVARACAARALDCPCTWEAVICEADAVAEVEMRFATKTTPDHMEVRRVLWNRTKHRVRPPYGLPYIPHVTRTREDLLHYALLERRARPKGAPVPAWAARFHRALARGGYRSIVFLNDSPTGWFGGGLAYLEEENWLDHPRHAEWWAKVEPYLRERIEAERRGEKPAFCSRTRREESQLRP